MSSVAAEALALISYTDGRALATPSSREDSKAVLHSALDVLLVSGIPDVPPARKVYIANLPIELMHSDRLREMLQPLNFLGHTSVDRSSVDIITSIECTSDAKVAFVEFVDGEVAAMCVSLFNKQQMAGRQLRIGPFQAATATIERLSGESPQRVCTRTFSLGDVIWKCRTCQVGDETCVVCQSCFQNGDHKGHDVSFYVSRMPDGGCCDCGDESAWSPAGFCNRHGRLTAGNELQAVPPPLRAPAAALFSAVFAQLARCVLAAFGDPEDGAPSLHGPYAVLHPAGQRRLAAAVDWVTQTCVAFDGLCGVASDALCAPLRTSLIAGRGGGGGGGGGCGGGGGGSGGGANGGDGDGGVAVDLEGLDLSRAVTTPTSAGLRREFGAIARAYASDAASIIAGLIDEADTLCAGDMTTVDSGTGDDLDSAVRTGVDASATATLSLLDTILLADAKLRELGTAIPIALQALYLRLLTNAGFKSAFARAYATHYTQLATDYMHADVDDCLVFASQISVQFFNRPGIVYPLVTDPHTALFKRMLEILETIVLDASRSPTAVADSLLIVRKRYAPIISDLRFVLAITSVPRLLLRDPPLMRRWARLLAALQAFDTQTRQHGEHVEHEHDGWIGCFNFLIYITSLIRFVLKPLTTAAAKDDDNGSGGGLGGGGDAERAGGDMDVCEPVCEPCEPSEPCEMGDAVLYLPGAAPADEAFPWPPLLDALAEWARASDTPEGLTPCLLSPTALQPTLVWDATLGVAPTVSFHYPLHRFIAAAALRWCAVDGGRSQVEALLAELTSREIVCTCSPGSSVDGILTPLAFDRWDAACRLLPARVEEAPDCETDDVQTHGAIFRYRHSLAEVLVHAPLRLLGSVAAITANVWARNGGCMNEQCINYLSITPPLCRQFIDADRLAVQLGFATVEQPLDALGAVFAAFGHLRLLEACIYEDGGEPPSDACADPQSVLATTFGASWPAGALAADDARAWYEEGYRTETRGYGEPGGSADTRQRTILLEECLHLLLQLAAHPPRPAGIEHERDAIRAALTHMLLLKPRSFSELSNASVPSLSDDELPDSDLFQAILDEVATAHPAPTGQLYSLREGLAVRDYSLAFPHLSRTDHQTAAERIEAALRRAPATESVHRSAPSPVHPCFVRVRRLVATPTVLRVCRVLILHGVYNPSAHSGASRCVDRAIHLLELGARVVHDTSPDDDAASADARAAAFWQQLLWTPASEHADGTTGGQAMRREHGERTSLLAALYALLHAGESRRAIVEQASSAIANADAGAAPGTRGLPLCELSSRIGKWVLAEASRRDPGCARALQAIGGSKAAPTAGADKAKLARQKARDAAMARLKKMNSTFANTFADELDATPSADHAAAAVSAAASPDARGGASPAFAAAAADEGGVSPMGLPSTASPSGGSTAAAEGSDASGESAYACTLISLRWHHPHTCACLSLRWHHAHTCACLSLCWHHPHACACYTLSITLHPLSLCADAAWLVHDRYCIMCHGSSAAGSGGMVALAYAHASRLRQCGSPAAGVCPPCPPVCTPASSEHLERIRAAPQALFVCGHAMHLGCWQRHLQTHVDNQRLLMDEPPLDEAAKRETFCPLCRAASNVVFPLVGPPPGARASTPLRESGARAAAAHRWFARLERDGLAVVPALHRIESRFTDEKIAEASLGSTGLLAGLGGSSGGLSRNHAPALLATLQDLTALRNPARTTEDGLRLAAAGEHGPDGLPAKLLPCLMANWRGVALAYECAAHEWRHVSMPNAATMHSLSVMTSALALQPAVLLEALKTAPAGTGATSDAPELVPVSRTSILLRELHELLPRLLRGDGAPSTDWMGRTRDLRLAPEGSHTMLACNFAELSVVLALAMPPESEADARSMIDLLGLAVLVKALLRSCEPLDPHADIEPDVIDDPMDGGGDDDEELLQLTRLRLRLAATAHFNLSPDAPQGAALKRVVDAELAHFGRVAALLVRGLYGANGDAGGPLEPYALLGGAALANSPQMWTLAQEWAASLSESHLEMVDASLALGPPPRLPRLHLFKMPPDFASLTSTLHQVPCLACGRPPQVEPALCLLCGALLCAGASCRRTKNPREFREGECTRHARTCGLGLGIFALVHQGITLLIDGPRAAFYPSLYLDAHGEEDHGLRRGKPLYLSAERQAAIHRLWLAQSVPLEVARSRASASLGAIRLNHY